MRNKKTVPARGFLFKTKFLLVLLLMATAISFAQSPLNQDLINQTQERLLEEQKSYQAVELFLKTLQQKRQQLVLTANDINDESIIQAKFELELLQSNLVSVQLSLQDAYQELSTINEMIAILSAQDDSPLEQQQLTEWQSLKQITKEYVQSLNGIQVITGQHIQDQKVWLAHLEQLYLLRQQQDYQAALQSLERASFSKQQELLRTIEKLNGLLSSIAVDKQDSIYNQRLALEIALFEASEREYLSRVNLKLLALDKQIELLIGQPFALVEIGKLNSTVQQINLVIRQLNSLNSILIQRIDIINDRKVSLLAKAQGNIVDKKIISTLEQSLISLSQDLQQQLMVANKIKDIASDYRKQVSQLLKASSFKDTSIFNLQSWRQLWNELLIIPQFSLQYIDNIKQIWDLKLKPMPINGWLIMFLISVAFYLVWWRGKQLLKKMIAYFERKGKYFANTISLMIVTVVRRHFLALTMLGWFALLIFMLDINFSLIGLPIYLMIIWLVFKSILDLARFFLVENVNDIAGQDVRLYRSLKWLFTFVGLVAVLAVVARELAFSAIFIDFLVRIIMLFLAVVGLLLLRWWKVIPNLLYDYLSRSKAYVRRVVNILSLSGPLIIFANALIGLLADMALLKELFIYQAIFLLILTSYIVARGLIKDLFEIISESLIRYVKNGWLWSNMLLRPVDKLVRLLLFITTLYIFYISYGGTADSEFAITLSYILIEPLFHISETPFNILSFVYIIFSTYVIIWASKWSRELAYRWIYANTRDLGLRNSLAAFTQYMTVLVIIMILLAVLGFDAYSLSLIFAGLMVPIGFGMRDLANNFVSGILLLIERPIRKGDFVSVDQHNGEVIHIGMRSITVRSFDNMEVIVPNADIFYKPFINWTLQDDIVRLISTVEIERTEDPYKAQAIILNIIQEKITAIVKDPEPQVFFMRMENGFIVFDIRYFIDLRVERSRDKVRSQVMFHVWDAFKQHGITFPYPKRDINLNEKN